MALLLRMLPMLTVTGSVVLLLSLAVSRLTRRHLPAVWHRRLFCLNLLFFLIPFGWLLQRLLPARHHDVQSLNRIVEIAAGSHQANAARMVVPLWSRLREILPDTVALVWLTVTVVLLLRGIWQYVRFRSVVRRTAAPVTQLWMMECLCEIQAELRVRQRVGVLVLEQTATPMLTGFLRPMVILPGGSWNRADLELVFRHELTHLRHRDAWVRALLFPAQAAHWFNPLFRVLSRELCGWMEYACDSEAVRNLDDKQRMRYGNMILDVMSRDMERREGLTVALCDGKQQMKERLNLILQGKPKVSLRGAFAAGLIPVMIASGGLLLSAAGWQERESAVSATGFVWPTDGGYIVGGLDDYPGHNGIDIPRPSGTDVYAVKDGIVTMTANDMTGLGNHLMIDHGDGDTTLYAHCKTLAVQTGDEVEAGQLIATVGRSGAATGNHLHFELYRDGERLDPTAYLPAGME